MVLIKKDPQSRNKMSLDKSIEITFACSQREMKNSKKLRIQKGSLEKDNWITLCHPRAQEGWITNFTKVWKERLIKKIFCLAKST